MSLYQIQNRVSGAALGVYEGASEDAAIRAMLADAKCLDEPSTDLVATPYAGAGLSITYVVARDGFGGDETEDDVLAYCQAVADLISEAYPDATEVRCRTGLSSALDLDGAGPTDCAAYYEIRTACREAADEVWEAGDFWTTPATAAPTPTRADFHISDEDYRYLAHCANAWLDAPETSAEEDIAEMLYTKVCERLAVEIDTFSVHVMELQKATS